MTSPVLSHPRSLLLTPFPFRIETRQQSGKQKDSQNKQEDGGLKDGVKIKCFPGKAVEQGEDQDGQEC